jgi:opacity protein-like surface antigen
MTKRGLLVCALVGVLALPVVACAQNYGDGLGVGGVLVPDEGNLLILGTTRLGESLGFEMGVGLDLFDSGSATSTDVGLTFCARKYWNTESAFQPFFGGRFSITHSSWDYGNSEGDDTEFGLSAVVGGEYFVTKRVSLDGEVGVGIFFGSFRLATGTRLAAFMYL